MSGHDLENKRQSEKDPATPPAHPRQEISRLPNADKRIGRGARTAEARGQSAALAALK